MYGGGAIQSVTGKYRAFINKEIRNEQVRVSIMSFDNSRFLTVLERYAKSPFMLLRCWKMLDIIRGVPRKDFIKEKSIFVIFTMV